MGPTKVKTRWEQEPSFRCVLSDERLYKVVLTLMFRPMSRAGYLIRNTLKIQRSTGPAPYRTHSEVKGIASRLIATSALTADIFAWERDTRAECEKVFLHLEEFGDAQGPSLDAAIEATSIAEAAMFLALTRSVLGDEDTKEDALVAAAVALDSGILHGEIGNESKVYETLFLRF